MDIMQNSQSLNMYGKKRANQVFKSRDLVNENNRESTHKMDGEMREIKFRAWDKEQKKMVYDNWDIPYFKHKVITHYNCGDCMQYTGLHDKNGVGQEVYAKDIITFPYITPMGEIGDKDNEYSYYGEVVFREGMFLVKPIKSDDGFWKEQLLITVIRNNGRVIGNKFQNPELLEAT